VSATGGIQLVDQVAAGDVAPVVATSGNQPNAAAVATLPGVAGKTTYITGFEVTASGATAGLAVDVTVTGPAATLHYSFVFPAGAAVGAAPLIVQLPRALPAAALNTPIVVTLPAGGAGNTNAAVNAHGYQI
jgi:hypothetical protein